MKTSDDTPLTPVLGRPIVTSSGPCTSKSSREPEYWSAYCSVAKKDWPRIEHIGSLDGFWPAQNADMILKCMSDRSERKEV